LPYDKWVEDGLTENDVANAEVERILAARTEKAPYVDGAQLDELAAVCKVDGEAVRRARRE
jgi:hypothetical protein